MLLRKSRSYGVVWNNRAVSATTIAIPDVIMMLIRLFTVCFNVFARWH